MGGPKAALEGIREIKMNAMRVLAKERLRTSVPGRLNS